MRAMDCVHDDHQDMHFSATDDDALVEEIKRHRDEHHPEITDDQVRELVSASAYDE